MMHINDAKRALGVDVAVSSKMQTAIDLWTKMLLNNAPWLDDTTQSLGLPAAISGEFARLTLVELESEVSGSVRADYLQAEYKEFLDNLRNNLETAYSVGGMIFKPYVDGKHIAVDCVPAWRFFPTSFHRGKITGAVFVEQATKGRMFYTRMEAHALTDVGYSIRNMAFFSANESNLGAPCPLQSVDAWADLEPEVTIRFKDGTAPEDMLFAFLRVPVANNIDPDSPLGVSVFANAVDLIREADKQYSRILWEYEGSELAVDASAGALQVADKNGRPTFAAPQRKKRLFRELNIDGGSGGDLYKVFSPTIRDSSLFTGLDKLLKRIEFNCALSYGALSDPQTVEKTAEEVKSGKQRSFAAVSMLQQSLQKALEDLLAAMDFYATLYKLAPAGKYEASFSWGDGILQDSAVEYARRKEMVDAGYLKPEKLVGWYFGVDDNEAKEYIPADSPALF